MSRPKSPERIQADIDKAIRKERQDRKRAEKDARRKLRQERKRVREHVAENGISKIRKAEDHEFGFRAAVAFHALVYCEGCGRLVRDEPDKNGFCERCKYGKEVAQGEGIKSENTGLRGPDEAGLNRPSLERLSRPAPAQLKLEL
jgi:hypothetical protein